MKMKHVWKKAAVLGMTGAMLLCAAVGAAPVYNTETDTSALEHPNHGYSFDHEATKYVIDTNKRGILHIHKSENNNSQADDTDTGIGSMAGQAGSDGNVLKQFGDVTYTIYRVADIVQGHLDGTGTSVSVEYKSLIKDSTTAKNTIAIPSGLSSAEELDQWVSDLLDSDDASKRMSNLNDLPHWSETTDANGNATFDGEGAGLPLGIYIVYESAYPSQITDPQPFVVSIPTTSVDDGNNDTKWPGDTDDLAGDNMVGSVDHVGVYWVYDVQAHPKNSTKNLSVEKHIVADEGAATMYEVQDGVNDPSNDVLTDAEDYEIGDMIRYWTKAEVPSTIGEIEVFYLLDRMSVGQTFVNDVADGNRMAQMEVWGKSVSGEMVYIPRYSGTVENYRVVSADEMVNVTNEANYTDFYGNSMTLRDADQPKAYAHENVFAVLFNTQSLSEDRNYDGTTKRAPLYSEVYVTYNMTLNEKALVGDPGNVNDIALVVSHRTVDNQVNIENQVHVPQHDVFEPFVDPETMDVDVINPQCIDTRVYTYAAQVIKIGEGTADMAGVTFELRDSRGNVIPVSRYTEADRADLEVDDCAGRIGDYYVDKDAEQPATITIDADQEVYIYGLETGTYQLVETKTLNGYQLLKEPIVLTVVSESAVAAQPMNYHEDRDGAYFKIEDGKGYYIWQDDMKLKIDVSGHAAGDYVAVDGEVYSYDLSSDNGSMSHLEAVVNQRYSYRWTDSETLTYGSNYGMEEKGPQASGIFEAAKGMYEDGLFSFTVLNRHGFNIPSTGGMGTTLFVAVGSGVAGMGMVGMLLSRKRKKDEDAV